MYVLTGIVMLAIGGVGGYQLANMPKIKDMKRNRAIQEKFFVKTNEFTYVLEDEGERTYIVALNDREFRVKFSDNTPLKVVFSEELETVE